MLVRERALCMVAALGLLPSLPACTHAPAPAAKTPSSIDDELLKSVSAALETASKPYPKATTHRVADRYDALGIDVPDDYAWLEENNSPDTQAWVLEQNAFTRAVLDKSPVRRRLRARVAELMAESGGYRSVVATRGLSFAEKTSPRGGAAKLVSLPASLDSKGEEVLFDPALPDSAGKTQIAWIVPSHSGALVAFALTTDGVHARGYVLDVATKKRRSADAVVNLENAARSLAWLPDDTGFYFVHRDVEPGAAPELAFHTMAMDGRPDSSFRTPFAAGSQLEVETAPSGDAVLVTARAGSEWGSVSTFSKGRWTKIAAPEDHVRQARWAPNGDLYLLSEAATVLAFDAKALTTRLTKTETSLFDRAARVAVGGINPLAAYVTELLPTQAGAVLVVEEDGETKLLTLTETLFHAEATLSDLTPSPGGLLVRAESPLEPSTFYRFDIVTKKLEKTPLIAPTATRFDDAEVIRLACRSKDGASVPLTVVRKKGLAEDGSNPTWLTAQGAYGHSLPSTFDPIARVWLDAGFVLAFAHIRGGRERGEAWHRQGMLTNKQNSFDDLAACADKLVEAKYTKPAFLVMETGPLAGPLAGAMLTQHSELFGAVVARDGTYDLLRHGRGADSAADTVEYGSVKVPSEAKALFGYSPYHRAREHVFYPPSLLTTLPNRDGGEPWQSWKMAARLQAATEATPLILLRTGTESDADALIDEQTDVFAFVFRALGVPYTP